MINAGINAILIKVAAIGTVNRFWCFESKFVVRLFFQPLQELMEQSAIYAEIYNSQLVGDAEVGEAAVAEETKPL